MKWLLRIGLSAHIILFSGFISSIYGQNSGPDITSRLGISGGLGVSYHTAQDIVNRINGSGIAGKRVDDFKSAVEFFGAVSIPLTSEWIIKPEYAYMIASHSLPSAVGIANAEFSYVVHMPSMIVQYVLFTAPTYCVKAGAGFGYHLCTYNEKYSSVDRSFSASGAGSLLEFEASNALGDDLAVYLGVQARWDFIGDLKDNAGNAPLGNLGPTSLNFFGIGARLGATYYF